MVRSKFPGKPSKLINRKLTRASTSSAFQENEATKTAEDINYGLKIFKGIFGFDEEDKGSEFCGFSPREVQIARERSKIRRIQVEKEYKARGVLYVPYSTGKTTLLPASSVNKKQNFNSQTSYSQKNNELPLLSDKKPNEPSSSNSVGKGDILPVFRASVKDSSKENNFVRTNNKCSVFKVRPSTSDTQDKGGGVPFDSKKKFVLPSRSVHSSRVIKPNKRFLDTDLNIGSSGASDNNDACHASIKLKKAKLIVDSSDDVSPFTWCNNKGRKEGASNSVECDEDSNINKPCSTIISTVNTGSNENPSDNNSSASAIVTTSGTTTTSATTTTTTTATAISSTTTVTSQMGVTASKVIIRKARLKIDNELPSVKGPFSEKFENPKHASGTVVCGVCGAVRFYRFVKQTRKFGIYSCEACRKFISRMIRETHVSSSLQCLQGDGKCVVPLIMTTVKWNSAKNRIPRCEACWLKMCLRCYCMPDELHKRLTDKLPKSMHQDFNFELSPKPKSIPKLVPKEVDILSGDETSTNRQRRRAAINSLVNIARFTGRVADETVENQLLIARNLKKKATAMMRREVQVNYASKKDLVKFSVGEEVFMRTEKTVSKRGLLKNDIGDFKTNGIISAKENVNSGVISMTDPKKKKKRKMKNDEKTGRRQRINIKGPRVKHVCRSASLVLGQPVATFSSGMSPLKNKTNTKESDGEQSVSASPAIIETSQNTEMTEMANGKPVEHSCVRMRQPSDLSLHKEEPPPTKTSRAVLNQSKPLARTLQDLGRQNCELLDGVPETGESAVVSIDFWESYDPEEVCKTGFALIGSDVSFKARALCFLCGSAGMDRLIHCACCCEPYHRYCVEGGDCNKIEDKGWWRVDWVCPRCTLCNACGLGSGPQLSCQRCHKSYHTECLAADRLANRLHSADRPWVCPSCLRCKSCNVAAVYKFIGNLPLCKGCFKLRQRGNFCPLCQRCYEDNDFDTKMMECSQCKCWVHAKCEGLSNEKYEVLSFLPESVEFVCSVW